MIWYCLSICLPLKKIIYLFIYLFNLLGFISTIGIYLIIDESFPVPSSSRCIVFFSHFILVRTDSYFCTYIDKFRWINILNCLTNQNFMISLKSVRFSLYKMNKKKCISPLHRKRIFFFRYRAFLQLKCST